MSMISRQYRNLSKNKSIYFAFMALSTGYKKATDTLEYTERKLTTNTNSITTLKSPLACPTKVHSAVIVGYDCSDLVLVVLT